MASNVKVEISSIANFSEILKKESTSMLNIVDDLIKMTADMEDFFDTPAARMMKDGLMQYLNQSKTPCTNLGKIAENIDKYKDIYANVIKKQSDSVRG